jgi:hypothetical protein
MPLIECFEVIVLVSAACVSGLPGLALPRFWSGGALALQVCGEVAHDQGQACLRYPYLVVGASVIVVSKLNDLLSGHDHLISTDMPRSLPKYDISTYTARATR